MKWTMMNIASILCATAAVFGMYMDRDGWGWFLLVAVLLHVSEG